MTLNFKFKCFNVEGPSSNACVYIPQYFKLSTSQVLEVSN